MIASRLLFYGLGAEMEDDCRNQAILLTENSLPQTRQRATSRYNVNDFASCLIGIDLARLNALGLRERFPPRDVTGKSIQKETLP